MPTAYEVVTARIIEALERGTVPWRKPWSAQEAHPMNAVTRKPYRGVNVFVLTLAGFTDPRWLSFRQALALGSHVRKGEHGTPIVFLSTAPAGRTDDDDSDDDQAETVRRSRPIMKYYTVFSVEQCEGLTLPPLPAAGPAPDPIEEAERIVAAMPSPPRISHDGGSRAYYRPATDSIHLPARAAFTGAAEMYSTLFHELAHSTGHASRLNRHGLETGIAPFGSETYSREELAAEFGAAFLCAEAGVGPATLENSAAYIASWLRALKSDAKMAVIAAGQGQRAADYIMNRQAQAAQEAQEERRELVLVAA